MSKSGASGQERDGSDLTPFPAAEIEALAREAGSLARTDPKRLAERLASVPLRDQAELALRLPPRERLEVLLHARAPMRLVRALPDFEAYLTVREVGPSDALPLLALASASQIVHLMDLEAWRGDRFDAARAGAWVALLLEAGEATVRRLLRNYDDEALVLLLAQWAGIEAIEPEDGYDHQGAGETEAGTEGGFVSPDGHYRFRPVIPEHAAAVRRTAEILFHDQQDRYFRAVWATCSEVIAEVEEEARRWRQSRMEEHGFPPLDEALDVYAPPRGIEFHAEEALPEDAEVPVAPRTGLRVIGPRGVVASAVDLLAPATREGVLLQLTSLSNHLLVADGGDAGDPDAHRAAIEKGASFVGIALAARGVREPTAAGTLIARVPIKDLFREGHERAAVLRRKALGLVREGWASVDPHALDLLDAPILPRVRALLGPHALYFDLAPGAGGNVREFRTLEEIEETRVALEVAEILGRVFVDRLGLSVSAWLQARAGPDARGARFSTMLLTALAWHAVRGEPRVEALPEAVAMEFLGRVASRRQAPP